jgi:hypothetical protein
MIQDRSIPSPLATKSFFGFRSRKSLGGLRDEMEKDIEKRLKDLEGVLGERGVRDRGAVAGARKLMRLRERWNAEDESVS